jgi:hypothetical protein
MSAKPTGPESPLGRLQAAGYEVEVRHSHLLVHKVPYVDAQRQVREGTLISTYVESAGVLLPLDNHQVWFTGEFPCFADGRPIAALVNENTTFELLPGCTVRHRFSNKPAGSNGFATHDAKLLHYIGILSDQARVIDAAADARTGKLIVAAEETSVFRYADTASVRAEISMVSARLAGQKLAIVGLGGTGSYVLDQVAKTHVAEIHLFDGDAFQQHNAFRAPGAATLEELRSQLPKTEYFRRKYDAMHRGIVSHPYRLQDDNLAELAGMDFVFICVDNGPTRAALCGYLQAQGTAFIDVGMSIELVPQSLTLIGTCRVTLAHPGQADHVATYVPMMADTEDDALYGQNIQVADLNALNAQLAVVKWKQFFGFYHDDFGCHQLSFSVSVPSLTRAVPRPAPGAGA